MTGALLFGKLPAHGDFVARGLAPDARDGLDDFLSDSLAKAHEALGAEFAASYEQAPAWRFGWSDDDGWTAGAMALSVDAVGRRYPVLVGLSDLPSDRVEPAAELAEELIYKALGDNWTADRLIGAASALRFEAAAPWDRGEGWWTLGGERFTEAFLPGARPDGLMAAVLTPAVLRGERDGA